MEVRNICFIGAGRVGGCTATVIASKNPKIAVFVVDKNKSRIDAWNTDKVPITEPGLLELVQKCRKRRRPNLFFSHNIAISICKADIVFIAVNTPSKPSGSEKFSDTLDISSIESVAKLIANHSHTSKIVVIKSTVVPGTCENVAKILEEHAICKSSFCVLSNPEFLAAGTALRNLLSPDRIVIGSRQDQLDSEAATSLEALFRSWVNAKKIVHMKTSSAEIAKLASNALLAQRVSSINALSLLCEFEDASVQEVSLACGMDRRIGSYMLDASLGFGGPCLSKDLSALVNQYQNRCLEPIADYWNAIFDVSKRRMSEACDRVIAFSGPPGSPYEGRKIAILGAAFKKDTDQVFNSPILGVITELLIHDIQVSVYDPRVTATQMREQLEPNIEPTDFRRLTPLLEVCKTANQACLGAHGVVVVTDWDEFRRTTDVVSTDRIDAKGRENGKVSGCGWNMCFRSWLRSYTRSGCFQERFAQKAACSAQDLDWVQIACSLKPPKYVFDGRGIVDKQKLESLGLKVDVIGSYDWFEQDRRSGWKI